MYRVPVGRATIITLLLGGLSAPVFQHLGIIMVKPDRSAKGQPKTPVANQLQSCGYLTTIVEMNYGGEAALATRTIWWWWFNCEAVASRDRCQDRCHTNIEITASSPLMGFPRVILTNFLV